MLYKLFCASFLVFAAVAGLYPQIVSTGTKALAQKRRPPGRVPNKVARPAPRVPPGVSTAAIGGK